MQDHLLFRLYAPMAAWGDIAVGEQRPTAGHPSRSAILGLVSAALGLRREQTEALNELADSHAFGVRIDAPGETLRDYHTTQVPVQQRNLRLRTRRDELAATKLHTILSQRDYRTDACYLVALWQTRDNACHTLEQLAGALANPHLVLYLGRKSCPPALPLQPHIVPAETLKAAFDRAYFQDDLLAALPAPEHRAYAWEHHPAPGLTPLQTYPRRDNPSHRLRWQFSNRDEYFALEEVTHRS